MFQASRVSALECLETRVLSSSALAGKASRRGSAPEVDKD